MGKRPKRTKISFLGRLTTTAALCVMLAIRSFAADMFPFVLPWDDATPSATNLSHWLEKPAGKHGFVRVQDGHLFAGKKRLRIFGVNVCFGANFPTHTDTEKVAARIAKFGINCVRFHHMDMQTTPGGIFAKDGRTFDPDQLDRLDYFIAELKKHGIYTNLNLHVSRTHPDRPQSEKEGNDRFDKGVDNFSAGMIEAQKAYARNLLTHVNPYTKTAYIAEPAVALIEINNENALLFEWHIGALDRIAAPYRAELGQLWTQWLRAKYKNDDAIRTAWSAGAQAAGPELLKNGGGFGDGSVWYLEQHEGARAASSASDGALRVEVQQSGKAGWHVQLGQAGLSLQAGRSYTFTFRAKADQTRTIRASASLAHEPWTVFESSAIQLTTEWKPFRFTFKATATDPNARIVLTDLGLSPGTYEFTDASLTESAVSGDVPIVGDAVAPFSRDDYAGRTETAQRDWYAFLWSLEEKYWPGMYRYLRDELKAKSLIVGTQLFWSPFPIQQQLDVIDAHAYWQHPHFPNKQWDMNDWTVKNESMSGAADGGTISQLAMQRVAGKPYIVSEYNHSAPNTFTAETFPLICAYAALQDWDGIFAFAYSHRRDDWAKGFFPSFFDIDQHPVKMATLPASIAMFVRGDVRRATSELIAPFTRESAMERARVSGPRIAADATLPGRFALRQRVGVRLGEGMLPGMLDLQSLELRSDTNELSWNTVDKVVTVDAPKSKAVIGFAERRSYQLGDLKIDFGALRQGFGVVQATVLEGDSFKAAKRILITATADVANTDMKWTSAAKDSVGRNWGRAPSVVEGVSATITFPPGATVNAWALDERGQRRAAIPIKAGKLEIGPQHRTLWYEVAAE